MTFSNLDIPFPLFEADEEDASEYAGVIDCSLCGSHHHCFRMSIGCAVMLSCLNCGLENGLDADDREESLCRGCKTPIPFPDLSEDEEIVACYDCLRSGRAAITKDTELGMISWEQAYEGLTHGIPGMSRTDFELIEGEEGWMRARLPNDMMFELLRTPSYISIQGEQWQFCCKRPMIFLGNWSRERFNTEAEDRDGEALLNEIVQDVVPGLWEDRLHDATGIYVFRCSECGRRTGHWDIA
ncbi:MAG: CbrC family protein [Planctomycetota bacterium]|nr:CbrC family protein [Planctomycetota bacterium]